MTVWNIVFSAIIALVVIDHLLYSPKW